ncbi:MAG: tRNA glutamyl-Q(34) synthetase GluQRS [Acidobacteria bacterium]|nr:tRNA glutamyl-Q(34) synthetase GluQRS [Acidobacteriota bacterium]
MPSAYRGRFAPSPTGTLHFGSLVAAVGSWLDARAHGGVWLVRVEDIDEPRNQPGADEQILRTLHSYGLDSDEEVVWQTRRHAQYSQAIERLGARVFPCACTRKQVGERYAGRCRDGLPAGAAARALRLRVTSEPVRFVDRLHGEQTEILEESCGDFVLRRAGGLYSYQLAVVVDDAEQGITDVVRGADLLDSTARQIYLQSALGVPTPRYLHLPVATDAAGFKLSKQTQAPAIPFPAAPQVLRQALQFLGIQAGNRDHCAQLLREAIPAWQNRFQ